MEILPESLAESSSIWSSFNSTTDGFLIIGSFNEVGIAEGNIDPKIGKIKEVRINVHSDSENWAILSEVIEQILFSNNPIKKVNEVGTRLAILHSISFLLFFFLNKKCQMFERFKCIERISRISINFRFISWTRQSGDHYTKNHCSSACLHRGPLLFSRIRLIERR